MKRRFRSLAFRLVFLFVMVISGLLVGLAWMTLTETDRHFVELDEGYLGDKAVLVQQIAAHSDGSAEFVERISKVLSTQAGLYIKLYQQENVIYQSPDMSLPIDGIDHLRSVKEGAMAQWAAANQTLRVVRFPIELAGSARQSLEAVLMLDTEHHDHYMRSFRTLIWLYVTGAIFLGGLLGWWVTRMGLRPLRPIIDQAEKIGANQLSDRISTEELPVELEPLTQTLNHMLQRLETDFQRLSDFSTDLAHELRTPIGNMLVQAQVTLSRDREITSYREALHSVVEELERLSQMVSDMLYLAKTENRVQLPSSAVVNLYTEAFELAEFHSLTAEERQVRIQVLGSGRVKGDRSMIRRAISNLLANAIGHADPGSAVDVQVQSGSNAVSLSVSNNGLDIPQDTQSRLFDRFFRGDSSRSQISAEGAGLGLAITQAVMRAHGGQIKVHSANGLTVFTLVFPMVQTAQALDPT